MLYFEKSQPAPECLEEEKQKSRGTCYCDDGSDDLSGNVLHRLKIDFKNKCYLCQTRRPSNINIEHFIPHRNDKDLKFAWSNLFYACPHCNNTKQMLQANPQFGDLLNCTDPTHDVENKLRYVLDPFSREYVIIEALDDSPIVHNTRELLMRIFNGLTSEGASTTPLKFVEAGNIRDDLSDELTKLEDALDEYDESEDDEVARARLKREIAGYLGKESSFTSFKRWIVRDDPIWSVEFADSL